MISQLLSRIAATNLSTHALAEILRGELDWESFLGWAQFAPDRYYRKSLARQANVEVRLLCWLPGQSSALHNHGFSTCAFRVLAGTATELRLHGGDRVLQPGEIGTSSAGEVHQIANLGDQPLVTLHLYAPPLPADVPAVQDGRTIVILGGGWTGLTTATRLLARGDEALRIYLVERGTDVGRGIAFGTPDPNHLLNVPAADMSIDPENPQDFLSYLGEQGLDTTPGRFVSRRIYGDYVLARFTEQLDRRGGRVRLVRGEASDLVADGPGWQVFLTDGRKLRAEEVVLATGIGPTLLPPPLAPLAGDPRFVRNVWAADNIASLPSTDALLLVGSGLTALDILSSLRRQGHTGPIRVVSRNGRWPRPHLSQPWTGPKPVLNLKEAPTEIDALAEWLRLQIRLAGDLPWQTVFNSLRPHINTLWATLDSTQRDRFLSIYRSEWEVHRHRAPFSTISAIKSWEKEGWLSREAGEFRHSRAAEDGLWVTTDEERRYDRVLLCTGPDSDVSRMGTLWENLLQRGFVQQDPQKLGILSEAGGAVIGKTGRTPHLWAVGAVQRPRLFENTAVPDLSKRVQELVEQLLPLRPRSRPTLWQESGVQAR